MRVVSLHADVLIATSAIWQTNCTIVRSGDEAFAIDSPVLPEEIDALGAVVEQAGFPPVVGLLATHADWDHLLGRLAFPEAALGCAASTAQRLRAAPGDAQRELRAFDEQHYLRRPAPLSLGSAQALEVPGACEIGVHELALYEGEGHTSDGMAVCSPWSGVLAVGDYLSAVEIPVLGEGGSPAVYAATLERLRALVAQAQFIVPGHGPVLGSEQALELLEEDLAYLGTLREQGEAAELPEGRRGKAQRAIHAENVVLAAG
ncbi:MAG TPA: MBL fold metallo-hydrolase [Solirubrobacteraceae bacterium]|nr:MBL fold metallo-hydrolase [Solirubrobacteraceae bacterium]